MSASRRSPLTGLRWTKNRRPRRCVARRIANSGSVPLRRWACILTRAWGLEANEPAGNLGGAVELRVTVRLAEGVTPTF